MSTVEPTAVIAEGVAAMRGLAAESVRVTASAAAGVTPS